MHYAHSEAFYNYNNLSSAIVYRPLTRMWCLASGRYLTYMPSTMPTDASLAGTKDPSCAMIVTRATCRM